MLRFISDILVPSELGRIRKGGNPEEQLGISQEMGFE